MKKINRELLFKRLELVSFGLSAKAIIEQSDCFVFAEGRVATYDGEVSCSIESGVDFEGAVAAEPLLNLLRKMTEEEIEITVEEEELRVKGKRRRAGIRMQQEILLPLDGLEEVGDWKELPSEFDRAIRMVRQSTGKDKSKFLLTCVHIHPEWIEACDNFQVCRYPLETGVEQATLIRESSAAHIAGLGMSEFGETENWIHYRNGSGLVLSCRRYMDEYKDLTAFLEVSGKKVVLPKGLDEAIAKAEIFTDVKAESLVTVHLSSGKMMLEGRGAAGWYQEQQKAKFKGDPLRFCIAPELLLEILRRSTTCEVGDGMLKIVGENFTFVTCTSVGE